MNFVPCLAWVPKGVAKKCPDKLQLSTDELKTLIEETKTSIKGCQNEDDNDEEWSDISGSENEAETSETPEVEEQSSDKDEDFDSKYNLDAYDEEDDERPFMNIKDVAVFVDNKEDTYMTDFNAIDDDEKEEEEDFLIKDNDNLLVVGHVEEESSVLEIHVYNKEDESFYVHHDIVLPAYPLALEWLDFSPSEDKPGNFVAVGDMTPVIKIWDLDIVEVLEPDYCLGEKKKKDKRNKNTTAKIKQLCHKDAVISLSWNKNMRNLLASGSADSTIIIWNLQEGTALKKLKSHTNKVQALQWHPYERFLLSGCTDGLLQVHDCLNPDADPKTWKIEGEIEKVCWNSFEPIKFFCSTDSGFVHSFDLQAAKAEHSVQGHTEGVTGLEMSSNLSNILLTASMDKTIKLWNIENGFEHIRTSKLKVGSIYTARFSPDSELTVAVGGNNASNSLKVMDLSEILDATKNSAEDSSNDVTKKSVKREKMSPNFSLDGSSRARPSASNVRPPKKKFKNRMNNPKLFNSNVNMFNTHKM